MKTFAVAVFTSLCLLCTLELSSCFLVPFELRKARLLPTYYKNADSVGARAWKQNGKRSSESIGNIPLGISLTDVSGIVNSTPLPGSDAGIPDVVNNNDSSLNIVVFLIGLFPFVVATIEFWRRIAVGEPFGTGSERVYIGEDNAPMSSRGKQVLGKGALAAAYALFAIAAFSIGIAVYSVVTSP